MAGDLSRPELEAAYCWEPADHVRGRPETTAFRRSARLHQARWREANGHPIGSQPIAPQPGGASRPVGSRIPLAYAHETGANFLTPAALEAVRSRTSVVEPHQSFDHQRLWADLLWSPTLAFNLFGDLAADHRQADHALRAWIPDAPGVVCDVRFAYSPGRLDPAYLNSLRAFDAAFVLDLGDGTKGVVAVDTNYHEWAKPEIPRPGNLHRYLEVAERSAAFRPGGTDAVTGRTALAVMWLEHLLTLSMLQHASGAWAWGRYVVVYPAGNRDVADMCASYAELLASRATFSFVTLEALLDADALPPPAGAALRARYLVPSS